MSFPPVEGGVCPTCGLEGPFPDVFEEPLAVAADLRPHQERSFHGAPAFVFSMAAKTVQDQHYHLRHANLESGVVLASSLTRTRKNGPGGKALVGAVHAHLTLLRTAGPGERIDDLIRIRIDLVQEWRFQANGALHRRGLVMQMGPYDTLFRGIGANLAEFSPRLRGTRSSVVFREGADGDQDQADRRRRP